jgi:hypothetical protein
MCGLDAREENISRKYHEKKVKRKERKEEGKPE